MRGAKIIACCDSQIHTGLPYHRTKMCSHISQLGSDKKKDQKWKGLKKRSGAFT